MDSVAAYAERFGLDSLLSPDLLDSMQVASYAPGSFLVKAGDPVRHLMFFVEGRAKAYSSMENGTSLVAAFYTAFDVLGDVELFSFETYALNVEALEPSVCLLVDAESIRQSASRNTTLLMYLCGRLGRKLRSFNLASAVNLRYPVENRLASWLLAADRARGPGPDSLDTKSLGELADLLGASYRQLSRAVRRFRELGILDPARGRLRVLDRGALESFARDPYR